MFMGESGTHLEERIILSGNEKRRVTAPGRVVGEHMLGAGNEGCLGNLETSIKLTKSCSALCYHQMLAVLNSIGSQIHFYPKIILLLWLLLSFNNTWKL